MSIIRMIRKSDASIYVYTSLYQSSHISVEKFHASGTVLFQCHVLSSPIHVLMLLYYHELEMQPCMFACSVNLLGLSEIVWKESDSFSCSHAQAQANSKVYSYTYDYFQQNDKSGRILEEVTLIDRVAILTKAD